MRRIIYNFFTYLFLTIGCVLFIAACNNAPSKDKHTILTGTVSVLVDETFEPIIEDQVAVFESIYEASSFTLINKPEKDVIRALMDDSAQIAVMARKLTEAERDYFIKNKTIYPVYTKFAIDGLALIANKAYPDSVVALDDVINHMQGKKSNVKTMVFDNAKSSTVRFIQDFAKVEVLPEAGVYALKTNAEVIRYVENNPQSVGIIGINWIYQPDPDLEASANNIKVLGVGAADSGYYKPTQTNLALGKYPLARDLYLINCQGSTGLGMGFASFLAGERGQRIILKSGLLPDSIPPRQVIIRN